MDMTNVESIQSQVISIAGNRGQTEIGKPLHLKHIRPNVNKGTRVIRKTKGVEIKINKSDNPFLYTNNTIHIMSLPDCEVEVENNMQLTERELPEA
jgi:hypothetical protein